MRLILGVLGVIALGGLVIAQPATPSNSPAADQPTQPATEAKTETKTETTATKPVPADTPASPETKPEKTAADPAKPTPEKSPPPPAEKPKETEETEATEPQGPALEFVVIASGGMSGELGKISKIDGVRAALKNAFRYIPGDVAVGLRVSGHRVGQEEPDKSCQDSELLVPPAPQTKTTLLKKLGTITPKGNRSIAQSLSRAIVDLEKEGAPKTIVLITDGGEGCLEQDPSSYLAASSLSGRGYVIHVRGLGLMEAAAKQLKALAEATGGTFANAEDPFSLTQQITIAAQRALGKMPAPIKAAPTPSTPPAPPPTPSKPTVSVPATPPPAGVKPEPKEPPSVGPAPLPFNEKKFRRQIVADLLKNFPKPKSQAAPASPTFSTLALIIMGVEALLLLVALAAIVLLLLKSRDTNE